MPDAFASSSAARLHNEPARVCIVIGSLGTGGAETHLLRTTPLLDRRRFAAEVFTIERRGANAETMQGGGVSVVGPWLPLDRVSRTFVGRGLWLLVIAFQLLWHFLVRRPAIVHFYLPHAYLIAAPIALLSRRPICIMSRRSLNEYQKAMPRAAVAMERWLHKRMTALLGNSAAVVRELVEEEGAPAQRVRLLYNGVESAPVPGNTRERMRGALGLAEGEIAIGVVANLIPYKGHADLIDAAAALPRAQAWRLLLIGGDLAVIRDGLAKRAAGLGIANRVSFLGQRTDVAALLQALDIAVSSSHEEGFSNALLEAMAAGLPVVATAVGGNVEAAVQAETGFLVPPRDPPALAAALATLIADSDLRRRMGCAGRARVEERFSLRAAVRNTEELYRLLLEGSFPGPSASRGPGAAHG